MRGQLIKRYFITGLLIWVPLVITTWVLSLIVSTLDQSLRLLPVAIHPEQLFGFAIPGAVKGERGTLFIVGPAHRPWLRRGLTVGAMGTITLTSRDAYAPSRR